MSPVVIHDHIFSRDDVIGSTPRDGEHRDVVPVPATSDSVALAQDIANLLLSAGHRRVQCLGGGALIDAAKLACLMVADPTYRDPVILGLPQASFPQPHGCPSVIEPTWIPTTFGPGSAVTDQAVVVRPGRSPLVIRWSGFLGPDDDQECVFLDRLPAPDVIAGCREVVVRLLLLRTAGPLPHHVVPMLERRLIAACGLFHKSAAERWDESSGRLPVRRGVFLARALAASRESALLVRSGVVPRRMHSWWIVENELRGYWSCSKAEAQSFLFQRLVRDAYGSDDCLKLAERMPFGPAAAAVLDAAAEMSLTAPRTLDEAEAAAVVASATEAWGGVFLDGVRDLDALVAVLAG